MFQRQQPVTQPLFGNVQFARSSPQISLPPHFHQGLDLIGRQTRQVAFHNTAAYTI